MSPTAGAGQWIERGDHREEERTLGAAWIWAEEIVTDHDVLGAPPITYQHRVRAEPVVTDDRVRPTVRGPREAGYPHGVQDIGGLAVPPKELTRRPIDDDDARVVVNGVPREEEVIAPRPDGYI